jgi:hypothetical protein
MTNTTRRVDHERAEKTARGWRRKLTQEEDVDNLSSAYLAQTKELTVLRNLAKHVDIWDQMLSELDTAYDFQHIMREINNAIDEWRTLCGKQS